MKIRSLITATFFMCLCSHGFSQTKKGSFVLLGKTDLNFMFSKTTVPIDSIGASKIKNNKYGFTMGFGYFIADNLIVAFSGAYSYNFTKIELVNYRSGNITSTLAVVPQLGYYFPFEGKLRPSLSIGAGYLWLRERDSKVYGNDNIVYSLAGPSFNAEAGLSYFITQSVSFDLGAQYTYNRLEDKFIKYEVQKQNIVAGAFGVSIFF